MLRSILSFIKERFQMLVFTASAARVASKELNFEHNSSLKLIFLLVLCHVSSMFVFVTYPLFVLCSYNQILQ